MRKANCLTDKQKWELCQLLQGDWADVQFDTWHDAETQTSIVLGYDVNRRNIERACEVLEIQPPVKQPKVKAGLAHVWDRIKSLEQRVMKLEGQA